MDFVSIPLNESVSLRQYSVLHKVCRWAFFSDLSFRLSVRPAEFLIVSYKFMFVLLREAPHQPEHLREDILVSVSHNAEVLIREKLGICSGA